MAKYSWPLPGEGVIAEELLVAEIRAALGGVSTYSTQARKDAMLAELVAAIYNGAGLPFPIFTGDLTLPARLVYSPAISKLVAGATSFSLRNNADTNDNILVADSGAITVRSTIGGITTLTATTLTGTLSTVAQPNVTSVGTLTALTVSGAATSGVGSAAATAKPRQVLYQNQGLTTTSISDVSLASYVLPANALAANGQVVKITLTNLAAAQNCVVHLKFGATDLINLTLAAGVGSLLTAVVVRNGATAQTATLSYTTTAAAASAARASPAETLSGAVTIDFRGSVTAGGTLTYDSITVEYEAA
jgi:hypothetical protein